MGQPLPWEARKAKAMAKSYGNFIFGKEVGDATVVGVIICYIIASFFLSIGIATALSSWATLWILLGASALVAGFAFLFNWIVLT
jgi:uncharacterized protein (DUF983 family)